MENEGEINMNKKYIGIFITIILVVSVLFSNGLHDSPIPLEKRGENLIRFHVLANSDAPEDQQLKLKVRDKIIASMEEILGNVDSVEETRKLLKDYLSRIEEIAEEEILNNGKDYKVSAALVEDTFPTKRYGGVVFPAGRYEALKVVIGEGAGENWWCVMFPPLCFVDVKNGLTHEKTQQQLKEALSQEEYTLLYTSTSEEELPLQLKSKIVEIFKASRDQLNRLASKF